MRIRDILSIKEFDPVVDLSWGLNVDKHEQMLSNYIIVDETAEIFTEILESINLVRGSNRRDKLSGDISSSIKRAHIISGQYGTGKSYFLLLLSILLEMKNIQLAEKIIERFKDYPDLQHQLKYIKDNKKYFVVRINGELENEKEFKDVIQSKVIESLEDEFSNIQLSSTYQSIIKALENMYLRNEKIVDSILENNGSSFDDLIASLSNHKKEGLKRAEELMEEVLGVKPNIEVESLDRFFKDVNKELKLNGYDELVIVFDEFSAYLTSSVESKRINKDLGQIQTLAQLTSANLNEKVSFITSIHKDLKDVLKAVGEKSDEELDKVFGRFSSHNLELKHGNDLIKDSLKLDRYEFKNYESKYNEYINRLEIKYKRNFLDFYPFHPSTIDYLEPISKIYAQKTRTTLGFLKEVVKEKFFNREIEIDNKLNLIRISDLFDSFEDSIEYKNPEIIKVYNQNINDYLDDENVIKYIKALGIAYASSITKTNAKTELSAEDLRDIYQEDSESFVKETLNRVTNANYSNIIINNGNYRMLVNTSGVDIDKEIIKVMGTISSDLILNNLLDKAENRIFIKNKYSIKYNAGIFPFDIKLDGNKNSLKEFEEQSVENICNVKEAGKIIFVIPKFQEDYNQKELVDKYSKVLKEKPCNICIAFPEKIYFNSQELKEYGALKKIENDENISKNEELKKIIVKRRRKLEDKIRNKYIRQFSNLRNFTFVFGGGRVEDSLRQERRLYEELLFKYYYKFPREIKVENFNTRASLNEVIKLSFLRGEGEIGKKDNNSNGAKQLRLALQPLDLIRFTEKANGTGFQLKMPDGNISYISKEIMDIVLKEEKLSNKYKILMTAPYGLNQILVDLYIYIASKIGRIGVYSKDNSKKQITFDAKSMEQVSKNSNDYEVKINEEANIPVEVEKVWLALRSLKIIQSSKAGEFRANGNNEFNPFLTLSREIEAVRSNLADREERLKNTGVKTGKLKTLVNKLTEVKKIMVPKTFFEIVVTIPEIFKKESYQENLEELNKYFENLRKLTSKEVNSFEKSQYRIQELGFVIDDLIGYSDMKTKLKELHNLTKKYQNDFLNIELLHQVVGETESLKNEYNNEFRKRHEDYHEKYNILRKNLLESSSTKIKAIKYLEKLKFKNISSITSFIEDIENNKKCIFLEDENKILACKDCKVDNLKKYETYMKELDGTFETHLKKNEGIFINYLNNLKDEKIKNKMNYNENYREMMMALVNIERDACQGNEENIIEDKVNIISEELNLLINNEIINENNIEFNHITNKLILELEATGSKYLDLDEIKNKFNEIIENYKLQKIKNAKI